MQRYLGSGTYFYFEDKSNDFLQNFTNMFEQSGWSESRSKVWIALRKCVWALPCCKSVLLHLRLAFPRLFILTCGLDCSLTGAACMIVCSSSQGMFRNFDTVKWNGARENQKTFLCGSKKKKKNATRRAIGVTPKQFVLSEWAVRSRSGQCVSAVWDLLTQNKLQAFTLAD